MANGAFARSRAMFAAISALFAANGAGMAFDMAVAALGPYRSRGHGKNKPSKVPNRHNARRPVTNSGCGAQEMLRRRLGGFARSGGLSKRQCIAIHLGHNHG